MAKKSAKGGRIEPSFDSPPGKTRKERPLSAERVAGPQRGRVSARGRKGRASRSSRKARSGGVTGFLRTLAYWCVVLSIWGGIAVAGLVLYYGARMPSASTWSIPDRPPNVKIVSVSGKLVANRGATGGEALNIAGMSPYIPQAVMAIEDRRFRSHFGIDPIGLARAMVTNLTTGQLVQGGSTLTQQLAKNLFLSPERTLERKVQEVLLALWLEHEFSKDQIMEMYLNRVYFGSGAYGVEAASRRYFHKSARDVTLQEAALLAGLLKAPSRLSPARDPEAAEERAQVVLSAMREQGFVSDSEIASAMTAAPVKAKSFWSGSENYAADRVMDELEGLIGTVTDDLVVDTTIDLDLQRAAERSIAGAIAENGQAMNVSEGALVALDGTGAVRALIGGRDYTKSQFDRAADARRQPGSAFKPFVYAAALEAGRTPQSVRNDAPVRIGKWTPENYDGKYRGAVTLSDALTHSLNTIAAQLVMETGPKTVVRTAHRLGIESPLEANASIALGTSEVSLLELTSAYAPFMNGGYKATPHIIRRVSTADGKVLYENVYDNPPRVIDPAVAMMMNRMLYRVVEEGTGRKARIDGWQAAGKTGTSQSFRDALFVGYTANLVTGVWFGNDDGKAMKKVTGGSLPALAWHDFMTEAQKGVPAAGLAMGDALPAVTVGAAGTGETRGDDRLPPLPVSRESVGATVPRGTGGEAGRETGALVPPGDIPAAGKKTAPQTTLLDIILGN